MVTARTARSRPRWSITSPSQVSICGRAFGYVRDDVLKSTGNKQEPYVYGSLGGDDLALVPAKPTATGPQADPQTAVRRDYELALQAGDRDGWEAFLRAYPDGFYANLAKVQLKKIAAEETRVTASEKARQAEQEKARLAAEGARQAEQAKAAAAAKKAEEARIAAEKAKQVEQDKAAAAERADKPSRKRFGSQPRRPNRSSRKRPPLQSRRGWLRRRQRKKRSSSLPPCHPPTSQNNPPSICRAPCRPSCAVSAATPAPPMATGTPHRRRRSISSTSMQARSWK